MGTGPAAIRTSTTRSAGCLLTQSGSTALLLDPALERSLAGIPEATLAGLAHRVPLRDAEGSVISVATEGAVPVVDVEVADDDLVQLLYTSGTTSRPKGAMMSHRALVHEYVSCIVELDLATDVATSDLSSLRKAYYGVSIMPGPVLPPWAGSPTSTKPPSSRRPPTCSPPRNTNAAAPSS